MKNRVLLIVHCALFIATSQAQSLDSLLLLVSENNLELKVLGNEYLAALERGPQASQFADPELGVGVFPLPVETRLGAQSLRLSATQMLPWFGLLKGKQELEMAKARPIEARSYARKLDLIYEIKINYYKLYEINQKQSIFNKNIIIFKSLENLALAKLESGKGSAADVLRAQLKVVELEEELRMLELAKTKPQVAINQLLNRALNTAISTVDTLSFASLSSEKESLLSRIKAKHPSLQMLELQQAISERAISLNQLKNKPSVGLGVDYMMISPRTDADPLINGRDILQLRASIKIPIYQKKYKAKAREEEFKIIALDQQKEELFSRFMANIEQSYAAYETAKIRIDLYRKQRVLTKSAIQILESAYSTEASRFEELLRLERELVELELKMLTAVVESRMAVAGIERFVGF